MADDPALDQSQSTNLDPKGEGTTVRVTTPEGEPKQTEPKPEGNKGEPKAGTPAGQSSLLSGGEPQGGEPTLKPWIPSLPKDLKENAEYVKVLNQFDDQNGVIRAYLQGSGKTDINELVAAASDEDKAKYFKAIGRPDTPDGYALKMDLPESIPTDPAMIEGFKKVAHAAGLSPAQAQRIVDFYNKEIASAFERQTNQSRHTLEAGSKALRDDWRQAFEANIEIAKRFAKSTFSATTFNKLIESGLANDPDFVRDCFKAGERISEDTLLTSEAEPAPERTPGRFNYPSMEGVKP